MRRGRRRGRRIFAVSALLVLLVAMLPLVAIETACRAPAGPSSASSDLPSGQYGVSGPDYARPSRDSALSYPGWSIVYAHRDFAAALESGDEHAFRYRSAIAQYWTGLCAANRVAAGQGGAGIGDVAALSLLGLGFSAEMSVKG